MAVGSALAGRQARRRAGELADEQASPSDANYCIAHLRELMQHWDRKRRALRSATRMGGGETSMCVCVCGGGSCKREEKQKDGGWRGDEREETREGHVQRGGGSVTLQLLMQEKKNPPCISPPSVSAVENNSAAPVKKEGRIEAFWESHRNQTDHMVTGAPRGCSPAAQITAVNHCAPPCTIAPCISAQKKPETILWKYLSKQQISFLFLLGRQKETQA